MNNTAIDEGPLTIIQVWSHLEKRFYDCKIDTEDLPWAASIRGAWHVSPKRALKGKYYVIATIYSRTILLHRRLLGLTDPAAKVIHLDGDGLNNQRSNLHVCNHQENMRFRQPGVDFAARDAVAEVVAEYRSERIIGALVQSEFGLTQQGMYSIRSGNARTSPAADAYSRLCAAASVRTLRDLRLASPRSGKFGVERQDGCKV